MLANKISSFKIIFIILQFIVMSIKAHSQEFKPTCSEEQKKQLFSNSTGTYHLTCSLTLLDGETINKEIRISGQENSNIQVICEKGSKIIGMIRVASKKITNSSSQTSWSRPENIAVRGCSIEGGIRVSGIKSIGESHSDDMRNSSYRKNHTTESQDAAPKNVVFDRAVIKSNGAVPVYVDLGVTYFTLSNSFVNGATNGVAVYLDAESAYNTISNNMFETNSPNREVIAIDGSAYNKISGNTFTDSENGGIYVYRNCGEKGVVRHQAPRYNVIEDNVFLKKSKKPDIWLGSRDKHSDTESFCWQDKNLTSVFDYISKSSDLSALFPTKEDLFKKLFTELPIEIQTRIANAPNYGYGSSRLNEDIAQKNIVARNSINQPIKGKVKLNSIHSNILNISDACTAIDNNNGCQFTLECPFNSKIKKVKSACNLEYGSVTETHLQKIPDNTLKVLKDSQNSNGGSCSVDKTQISRDETSMQELLNFSKLTFSCKDVEKNGGDCSIAASISCQEN